MCSVVQLTKNNKPKLLYQMTRGTITRASVISLGTPLLRRNLTLFNLRLFLYTISPTTTRPSNNDYIRRITRRGTTILRTATNINVHRRRRGNKNAMRKIAHITRHDNVRPNRLNTNLHVLRRRSLYTLTIRNTKNGDTYTRGNFRLLFHSLLQLMNTTTTTNLGNIWTLVNRDGFPPWGF